MPLPLQHSRALAMGKLLRAANEIPQRPETDFWTPKTFRRHPFNLPFPACYGQNCRTRFMFMGHPGYSNSTDVLMSYVAAKFIHAMDHLVIYLRVISMEDEEGRGNWFFHEIGFEGPIYLVPGGNDLSGAGKHAKEEMDHLFELLGHLCDIHPELVIAACPHASVEALLGMNPLPQLQ